MKSTKDDLHIIGWREWVELPELGVEAVKVKVDTGARSSALHAFNLERFERDGVPMVRFEIHPLQRLAQPTVIAEAVVHDERTVRNSGGHTETRVVIRTLVSLAGESWPIDLTLTRRDEMGFRMLLGREAVRGRFLIDPAKSFRLGHPERAEPKKKRKKSSSTTSERSPRSKRPPEEK